MLPDCPSCDSADTLEAIRADGPLLWCLCSACVKTCLVKNGVVVHAAPKADISGRTLYE
jgi:hypothetical protein